MRRKSRIVFRSLFRIKVSKRENDRPIGYVSDLSADGLRLLLDQSLLKVGARTGLRLRTRDREGVPQQVDVDVICMWSRENPQTGYIEAGCTLEQPSQAFSALINGLQTRRKCDPEL